MRGSDLTVKKLDDLVSRTTADYCTYNRITMKTGGGKDDKVTRDELVSSFLFVCICCVLIDCTLQDSRRVSHGVKKSTGYWMNYSDSKVFKILHEV
jgi:hypothetical protein